MIFEGGQDVLLLGAASLQNAHNIERNKRLSKVAVFMAVGLCLILLGGRILLAVETAPAANQKFAWRQGLKEELVKAQAWAKEHPADPEAFFEMAISNALLGKLEEGWMALLKVDRLDKSFAPVAVKKYEDLLKKDPDNWRYHFRLAFGYFFVDKKMAAIKEFEKVMDICPDHIVALDFMAYVWSDFGDWPRAIALGEYSLKIDPNFPATHFALGQAYLKIGRYWKAAEEIAQAFKLRALGY